MQDKANIACSAWRLGRVERKTPRVFNTALTKVSRLFHAPVTLHTKKLNLVSTA